MAIVKTAQQALFKVLGEHQIRLVGPTYNEYEIDSYGYFEEKLKSLLIAFQNELNDNLTDGSDAFGIYLHDILITLQNINQGIREFHREEIYDVLKENRDTFYDNRLGYINHFIPFHRNIIEKAIEAVIQKQKVIGTETPAPASQNEFTSHASVPISPEKVNIAQQEKPLVFKRTFDEVFSFFWLLIEADMVEEISKDELLAFLASEFKFSKGNIPAINSEIIIPAKLGIKISKVDLFSFFWLMKEAAMIEFMSPTALGKVIATHFKYWRAGKFNDIDSATSINEFSRNKPEQRKQFKKARLNQIRLTFNDLKDKHEGKNEFLDNAFAFLTALDEAPADEVKAIS